MKKKIINKVGLCIKELDRIYGIREGSAGKVSSNLESNNFTPKTMETNIRQRGDVGGSAKKVGLKIKELERLYEIKEGNNQYSLPNNSAATQSDLATQMGMSVDTLQNYKLLAEMILELEELERLYGISHGGNRGQEEKNSSCFKSQSQIEKYINEIKEGNNQHEQKPNNSVIAKSQSDLAAKLGYELNHVVGGTFGTACYQ